MTSSALPAPSRVECLILDLFGVVVAFDDRLVYDRIAQWCPDPPTATEQLLDLVSDPQLIRGHTSLAELHARLQRTLGFKGSLQDFAQLWTTAYSEPMPGMRPLLRQLMGQCRLVLLSNVDASYWPTVRDSVPELQAFHARVLSFEQRVAKPEPEAFGRAIAAAGGTVETCYFVDDKPENIAAAAACGLSGHLFQGVANLQSVLRRSGLRVA